MNVANLELCKELYELSGWGDTCGWWYKNGSAWSSAQTSSPITRWPDGDTHYPAYSVGDLLRKLPPKRVKLRNVCAGWYCQFSVDTDQARMVESHKSGVQINHKYEYSEFGETPDDAACRLAIKLLEAGILKREAA